MEYLLYIRHCAWHHGCTGAQRSKPWISQNLQADGIGVYFLKDYKYYMDFYILINAVMGDERLWLGESRPLWGSDI